MLRPASRTPPPQVPPAQRPRLVPRDLPPPVDAFDSELDMLDVALSRLEPTASPQELDAETASDFARDLQELRAEQPGDDLVSDSHDVIETAAPAGRPVFGDWDLPASRTAPQAPSAGADFRDIDPIDLVAEELPLASVPVAPSPVMAPPQAPVPAPPPAPVVETAPRPGPVAAPPPPPAPVFAPPPAPVFAPALVPPPAPVFAPVAVPPPMLVVVPPPAPPAPVAVAPPTPPAPQPRPSLANAFAALLAAEQTRPPARALTSSATLSEAAIEDVVKRVLARMTDDAVHKVVLDAAERIIREEIAHLKNPTDSSGH